MWRYCAGRRDWPRRGSYPRPWCRAKLLRDAVRARACAPLSRTLTVKPPRWGGRRPDVVLAAAEMHARWCDGEQDSAYRRAVE
jgi:hypothetical protein